MSTRGSSKSTKFRCLESSQKLLGWKKSLVFMILNLIASRPIYKSELVSFLSLFSITAKDISFQEDTLLDKITLVTKTTYMFLERSSGTKKNVKLTNMAIIETSTTKDS